MNIDAINIIKGLCYSQLQLEDQRTAMISSGYFNDYQVFSQIDRKGLSKVYPQDLMSYLGVHRIAGSERQCQYLIWLSGSKQPFMCYENFQVYISNGATQNLEKMRASVINANSNINVGEEMVRNYSQRQLAKVYEKEIEYYRTIELLRQQFIKKHGFQFKTVISQIDSKKKGIIELADLLTFIHNHNVDFSIEEYQALCRKLNSSKKSLSYKQIMRAFTPFEPLNFPTYRKQNNMQKALQYITQQINKLDIDTQTMPYGDFEQPVRKTKTGFQRTIDEYRNPANQNRQNSNYFYDQNYYNELKQYKTGFFDPNKKTRGKIQNEMIGPQYHDHFFSDYYLYLQERNKSQFYYNKFGKRYAFENPMGTTLDQGVKKNTAR